MTNDSFLFVSDILFFKDILSENLIGSNIEVWKYFAQSSCVSSLKSLFRKLNVALCMFDWLIEWGTFAELPKQLTRNPKETN